MITWHWLSFDELSKAQLYDILALRETVFVIEQKCFYTDLDYIDQQCIHLLGMQHNKLVAYLRVIPKNVAYPDAMSVGRVVTLSFIRGQGIGRQMMDEVARYFNDVHPNETIVISAQLYLEKFYNQYQFYRVGTPYDEEGIPHIKMRKDSSVRS